LTSPVSSVQEEGSFSSWRPTRRRLLQAGAAGTGAYIGSKIANIEVLKFLSNLGIDEPLIELFEKKIPLDSLYDPETTSEVCKLVNPRDLDLISDHDAIEKLRASSPSNTTTLTLPIEKGWRTDPTYFFPPNRDPAEYIDSLFVHLQRVVHLSDMPIATNGAWNSFDSNIHEYITNPPDIGVSRPIPTAPYDMKSSFIVTLTAGNLVNVGKGIEYTVSLKNAIKANTGRLGIQPEQINVCQVSILFNSNTGKYIVDLTSTDVNNVQSTISEEITTENSQKLIDIVDQMTFFLHLYGNPDEKTKKSLINPRDLIHTILDFNEKTSPIEEIRDLIPEKYDINNYGALILSHFADLLTDRNTDFFRGKDQISMTELIRSIQEVDSHLPNASTIDSTISLLAEARDRLGSDAYVDFEDKTRASWKVNGIFTFPSSPEAESQHIISLFPQRQDGQDMFLFKQISVMPHVVAIPELKWPQLVGMSMGEKAELNSQLVEAVSGIAHKLYEGSEHEKKWGHISAINLTDGNPIDGEFILVGNEMNFFEANSYLNLTETIDIIITTETGKKLKFTITRKNNNRIGCVRERKPIIGTQLGAFNPNELDQVPGPNLEQPITDSNEDRIAYEAKLLNFWELMDEARNLNNILR